MMIEYLYLYLVVIVYTIFIMYVGFKLALLRWNQKENQQKLENYDIINIQLSDTNKKYIDLIEKLNHVSKSSKEWYISQLKNVSYYLKEKHNDRFLEIQLVDVFNKVDDEIKIPGKKKEYDMNIILDKITKNGIDSLTKDEFDFLNNKGDENKTD